jgi:Delta24-sterol reductase
MSEAMEQMKEATDDASTDYLNGIMHSQDDGVICTRKLTNDVIKGVKVRGFIRPTDPWFYLRVKKILKEDARPVTKAAPIVNYLFRYDRGGF